MSCRLAAGAATAENIGVAASVVRDATGTVGADTRALATGAPLLEDEVIRTGAASKVQILFQDETALTIGSDAEVTLDEFVYDATANTGTFSLDAARGAFRFVTGNLSSASYAIDTPIATIGVRGTVLDVNVEEDGEVTVTLVEGGAVITALGGAGGAAGEVGGSVELTAPGQTTTVSPGQDPTEPTQETDQIAAIFDILRNGEPPVVDLPDVLRDIGVEPAPAPVVVDVDEPPVDDNGGDIIIDPCYEC